MKLQKAVTDNMNMESHILSLENQKEELLDCNMLLKREVETMRVNCEDLRKMINPDLPSTSIFEAWLDPNKAKVTVNLFFIYLYRIFVLNKRFYFSFLIILLKYMHF